MQGSDLQIAYIYCVRPFGLLCVVRCWRFSTLSATLPMAPIRSPYPAPSIPEESFVDYLFERDLSFEADCPFIYDGETGKMLTRGSVKSSALSLAASMSNLEQFGLMGLTETSTVAVASPNSMLYPIVVLAMVSI